MGGLPFCHLHLLGWKSLNAAYPNEVRTLGDAIRKRRLDLGLRQRDVAKQIGCNKTSVANWEKNRNEPRIIHLAGVVAFLGYDPFARQSETCAPTAPNGESENGRSCGERLLSHRKARGLTQKQFARKLGVDPCTLAKWEQGKREPRGDFRLKAEALLQRNRRL
jgi:transcriptional regulator with XRE-family HTH domain